MKKFSIIAFLLLTMFLTACEYGSEPEKHLLVAACSAEESADGTVYKFFVSVPSDDDSEEEGSLTSGGKIYTYTANSFAKAVEDLKKSSGSDVNFSHLSLFVADTGYISNYLDNDTAYLSTKIKISPLVYICVCAGDTNSFFDCINKEYNASPSDFIEKVFKDKTPDFSCTLSEAAITMLNNYYTVSIPVVQIKQNGSMNLPFLCGALIYSKHSGTCVVTEEDFLEYELVRKKIGRDDKNFELNIEDNKLCVAFNVSAKDCAKISEFSQRYAIMGFDVLNTIYYCKKCFINYDTYQSFAKDLTSYDIIFEYPEEN